MSYAKGRYAFGFCDKTGFRYPLSDLVPEFKNGVKTGFLVGRDVVDPDQPQNFLGRLKIFDPQSLQNPRPDTSEVESRRLFGFDPVGNDAQFMTAKVGTVTVNITDTATATLNVGSFTLTGQDVSLTASSTTLVCDVGSFTLTGQTATFGSFETLTVTVQSTGYGNKYYIGGSQTPTLTLNEGSTYRLDQSDSSNSGHPIRFSTTSDGTHGGGSEYTTGVTTAGTPGSSGAYTQIVVAVGAPTLYYYCTNHSGMGGQANTP
jgi:hypothetical protein